MIKLKEYKTKIAVTLVVLVYAAVLWIFKVPCPILKMTGRECIGCGMTRAILYALKFDFKTAFSYHFMFWSVPLLYASFLFDGKLFRHKISNYAFYIIIFVGFALNLVSN